ncbi:DUF4383 domain-containing protein [Nocardia sp. alder85J]|uniref:DUF4383 domain-containing protein n=1 Tax=Nocardia sp. alder85J TaxID=2862949 RepID=UPI001CD6174E|nr:DUF4383 domain-containing protein [Nocardia sp. alder85J]MCX4093004.1 DUF4383 domain-containing protein [Nocardia sp. alder85J]
MLVKRLGPHATRWYCLVVGIFLAIRALTTLAMGTHFGLPGDGWRSIWQLILTAILLTGLTLPRTTRAAVTTVGLVYLAATAWELLQHKVLLGAIPVDMRDHIVHPLLAALAAATLVVDARRPQRAAA